MPLSNDVAFARTKFVSAGAGGGASAVGGVVEAQPKRMAATIPKVAAWRSRVKKGAAILRFLIDLKLTKIRI